MKKAYLTIDDTPSKDFLKKVNYLKENNIPAILFCVGVDIEKRFYEVVSAIKMGFIIGNHSYSHPYFSDLSLDETILEIQKTDIIIDQLYVEAGIQRENKFFRFPYFDNGGYSSRSEYQGKWSLAKDQWNNYPLKHKKDAIQGYLRDLGYKQPMFEGVKMSYFSDKTLLTDLDIRCTFDQAEYYLGNKDAPWGLSNEESILSRIEEDFPYEGRSLNCKDTSDIILLHDHDYTTELFFKIVDRYINKGLAFQDFK